MAEVDTSFYKDAQTENPLDMAGKVVDYRNKLLGNQQKQIEVQTGQVGLDNAKVELAMKRFGIMNSAVSGIMGDPDFGKKDIRKKVVDVVGRLVKDEVLTVPHAVEALKGIPDDPAQQATAIRNIYGQTLSAEQRGSAFLGSLREQDVGSGKVITQTPLYPGKPTVTRATIENRLSPQTSVSQDDPTKPNYGAKGPLGQPGIPPVQQGPNVMPATPQAPARAMVPSTPKVMGDREAIANGTYEAPATLAQRIDAARPKPVISDLPPGTAEAMQGSAKSYDDAMAAAGKYAQRVNPLRQAIPLLEKMKETDIGPTSERWNDIKSTAVTLGAGTLAGIDPQKIRDYNELKKYFSQYTSQAAATLGPKTNDGLATAVTSNPNVHMDKLSATDLSKMALGAERMQQAGAHEFDEQVAAGKAQPGQFSRFMLKWGTQQDPRAFVYDLMDKKAQDAVKKLPPAERAKVAEGMRIAEKHKLLGDVHRE
ncbi:MAG: hypothetical protein JWR80_10076 [Bradyrhizobium sp.]|nr:hypothetical protein [Bradyrhizobium sp.]